MKTIIQRIDHGYIAMKDMSIQRGIDEAVISLGSYLNIIPNPCKPVTAGQRKAVMQWLDKWRMTPEAKKAKLAWERAFRKPSDGLIELLLN